MTELIVDTSVLSYFAPGRRDTLSNAVLAEMRATEDAWRIPTLVFAEIEEGVAKLRRSGAARRAADLSDWLAATIEEFADRIVPLTAEIALETGRLSDEVRSRGLHPGLPDVVIAATARARDAVVLTRNLKHFDAIGVRCIDPFEPGAFAEFEV